MEPNERERDDGNRIPAGAYGRVVLLVVFLVVVIALGTYACDRAG
jgi:hypothetical protein